MYSVVALARALSGIWMPAMVVLMGVLLCKVPSLVARQSGGYRGEGAMSANVPSHRASARHAHMWELACRIAALLR
jgi:hypothetical protein